MTRGYLSLVLHTHLPYVRHPEFEGLFEERWLFEAITECYIPLLRVFDRLADEGIPYRVTVSLSPTLITMLQDPLLQSRYRAHLASLRELADREVDRTREWPDLHELALMYQSIFSDVAEAFEGRYRGDLVSAFGSLQERGYLEIITCGATHGYLPLLQAQPQSVRAQVHVAADTYERAFGRRPKGIWLPECGYFAGLEDHLADAGIRYFIVDSHGIENADVHPHHGLMAPIACANGVAAFGRDRDSSKQVWSAQEGFPGDVDYREYYRDIGYDLDFDYIRPYLLDQKTRVNTGIKYHRITGRGDYKELYRPDWAREKAAIHAGAFMVWRQKQIEHAAVKTDRPPIVVAPFDAELFGHWWFEGPQWIDFLIRKLAFDQQTVDLISPGDYLDRHKVLQKSTPSASSWGYRGYNEYWVNESNDWVLPYMNQAARQMNRIATENREEKDGTLRHRALNQAARSLLLAQASDWPFIMKTGTSVDYANRRVRDHLARFHYLEQSIVQDQIDETHLRALEYMDEIFPEIDYRIYAS